SVVWGRASRFALQAIVWCGAAVASAQEPTSTVPAYRHRLLGVYDVATGEPIEGAEVTDLKSGTKALTTKTGTVSLVFLPDGGSQIRVRKLGYKPGRQFASISRTDPVPGRIWL